MNCGVDAEIKTTKSFITEAERYTPVTGHVNEKQDKLPITKLERVCNNCGFIINSVEVDWDIRDIARDISYQLKGSNRTGKEIYAYVVERYYKFSKDNKKKLRQKTYDEVRKLLLGMTTTKFGIPIPDLRSRR